MTPEEKKEAMDKMGDAFLYNVAAYLLCIVSLHVFTFFQYVLSTPLEKRASTGEVMLGSMYSIIVTMLMTFSPKTVLFFLISTAVTCVLTWRCKTFALKIMLPIAAFSCYLFVEMFLFPY